MKSVELKTGFNSTMTIYFLKTEVNSYSDCRLVIFWKWFHYDTTISSPVEC